MTVVESESSCSNSRNRWCNACQLESRREFSKATRTCNSPISAFTASSSLERFAIFSEKESHSETSRARVYSSYYTRPC
ncbi:hypothetical protein AMTR_s00104p00141800 [Amborella trichopoda]|uniref:Uncharacterized protein n=1 Tax=Amborella trichopoda TaxID=13333 RepID=W1NYL5_AMBTC|nr:hypothetical protein AMTR_s00104p00141800 [Amborella trichopoda]